MPIIKYKKRVPILLSFIFLNAFYLATPLSVWAENAYFLMAMCVLIYFVAKRYHISLWELEQR